MIITNHHNNNKQIALNFVDSRDYLMIKIALMLSCILISTSHIAYLYVYLYVLYAYMSTYIFSQFYYLSSSRVYFSKATYACGVNKKRYSLVNLGQFEPP